MSEQNIENWSALKKLKKDFTKNIKQIYMFGTNGDQVIVITNDDNVYAFGGNSDGCLGLGHINDVNQPTLLPQLCQKQVINFEFGETHFVIALTKSGQVYSWGNNTCGQLGNGNYTPHFKPIIISTLINKGVIEIKTGEKHSIALTSSAEVYIWGRFCTTPTIMTTILAAIRISSISSGLDFALALNNNGDVFYWGSYAKESKNYGISWSQMRNLSEIIVSHIVCGPTHALLLSTKGIVYCFGENNFGQCGDGTNEEKINPTKVDINLKFIDIGATKNYRISIALAENGNCYVWGKCGEKSSNNPIKTPFNAINDALEFYSPTQVTYEPIRPTTIQNSLIMNRIGQRFNNKDYSDIAFKMEDKVIYAQKTHLINVCNHFEAMFAGKNWIESQIHEIEITNHSYSVYYAFIKYLYTDCVDIKPEQSIELLDLANCYLDEELKKRCVEIIKDSITVENVIAIYYSAEKYNSKELKECCIEFFANINMKNESIAENILENAMKLFTN